MGSEFVTHWVLYTKFNAYFSGTSIDVDFSLWITNYLEILFLKFNVAIPLENLYFNILEGKGCVSALILLESFKKTL